MNEHILFNLSVIFYKHQIKIILTIKQNPFFLIHHLIVIYLFICNYLFMKYM
jgi:hypothetical protein